jgi:hypothetical protein
MKSMNSKTQKWLEFVQLSSIPLCKLSDEKLPIGIASGCMVNFLDRRLILSVFNATGMEGNWAIELRYDSEKGTELYYPGAFNFIGEMKLWIPKIRKIDFSFAEIPHNIDSYFQELTLSGRVLSERKRIIFTSSLDSSPSKDEIYAFSGRIKPSFIKDLGTLAIEHHTFPGLKYERTQLEYHVFKLPVSHPGHEKFQGCSGAPIIDTKQNIVALVCSGNIEKNEIYGISLQRYKSAIEIAYSKLLRAHNHGIE